MILYCNICIVTLVRYPDLSALCSKITNPAAFYKSLQMERSYCQPHVSLEGQVEHHGIGVIIFKAKHSAILTQNTGQS